MGSSLTQKSPVSPDGGWRVEGWLSRIFLLQVLQLPPTFDLSMKQKATASMTARLASERPRLLPGGD